MYFFKQGLTWTKLSSTYFAARFRPSGFVLDDTGRSAFRDDKEYELPILAAINSVAGQYFLSKLNPTLSFTSGDVGNIPISPEIKSFDAKIPTQLIELHKTGWNNYEISWDFQSKPLIVGWVSDTTRDGVTYHTHQAKPYCCQIYVFIDKSINSTH